MKSPIIELLIGSKDDQTLLTAHQALLIQSPFFAEALAQFSEDATVQALLTPLPVLSLTLTTRHGE